MTVLPPPSGAVTSRGARPADDGRVCQFIALADLLRDFTPGGAYDTWDAEEQDIRRRICLCCGQPGHYQLALEAQMAQHGLTDGVCLGSDGRLRDGHHRVIAAGRLGIEQIPVESAEAADERWRRDHPVPAGTPCEEWKKWHWGLVDGGVGPDRNQPLS